MSSVMEGTLNKWTNVMKGWQYRWFVLEDVGILSYYTSKEKMMKGVRRGCVRLKGAVLGIDDQDLTTFTITVDHKTFHFQARDGDEREKWVRRLEDMILKHANRNRMQRFYGSSSSSGSQKKVDPLVLFDKKVAEADAYLQLMIEQVSKIEKKQSDISEEEKDKSNNVHDIGNTMLENIKHSIVLLQIAKNTANPINGIYQGPGPSKLDIDSTSDNIAFSTTTPTSSSIDLATVDLIAESRKRASLQRAVTVPETSYSSSDGEDDFYDANDEDDEFTSPTGTQLSPAISNIRNFSEPQSKTSDELYKTAEDNTSTSASLPKQESYDASLNSIAMSSPDHGGGSPKDVPTRNDGAIDYDALYEQDDNDDDISMESHGSVVTHLLSQVKIGMDLTKVVLPTFILERRSLLEMYADYFAHPDLFLQIADLPTPKERMVQVVRWYLSSYHAGRKSAVAKKPYNPVLGEIFQCHWDTPEFESTTESQSPVEDGPIPWCKRNQLTFIAEQVSHHPPISAFYAEHYNKRIQFTAHVWTKSKFLGLSIGVHNIGQGIVTLCDLNEEYICSFPNGYGRSILTVPWIELGGNVSITCPRTGYQADIEFQTKPFYGGKRNRINGEIFAPNEKKPFITISGEWSGVMEAKWVDSKKTETFIDVNAIPVFKKIVKPVMEQEDHESRKVWREVTLGLKLNDIELATNAKSAIEQRQRNAVKSRKETGDEWKNLYFKQAGDGWLYTRPLTHRLTLEKAAEETSS